MLRMTSKRVKEVVDKMRLPCVVALRRSFWFDDPRRDTAPQRMKRVLAQLATMPARCHITTLVMSSCSMRGHEEEILAGILAQCPELVHLDLSENFFGADGSGRLAGVLAQCPALAHLNLMGNQFGAAGAERLAGVLAQCPALAHLNISNNAMIGSEGAESLARVLAQCRALAHLDLSFNQIGNAGGEALAGVLGQCPTLVYLDLSWNNGIGSETAERLRAEWRGPLSSLLLVEDGI